VILDRHSMLLGRQIVDKNIAGIERELQLNNHDAILIQEMATSSFLTRGDNVLKSVTETLSDRNNFFSAGFRLRYVPYPLGAGHGLFSSLKFAGTMYELCDCH